MGRKISLCYTFNEICSIDYFPDFQRKLEENSQIIRTVFPQSSTQICVVHQIRNSCKYVVYKDKKEFTAV